MGRLTKSLTRLHASLDSALEKQSRLRPVRDGSIQPFGAAAGVDQVARDELRRLRTLVESPQAHIEGVFGI